MLNKAAKLKASVEDHLGAPCDAAVPVERNRKNPGNRMVWVGLFPLLSAVVATSVAATLLGAAMVGAVVGGAVAAVWYLFQPLPLGLCRRGDELVLVELSRRHQARKTLRAWPTPDQMKLDRSGRPPFRRVTIGDEVFWAHMVFDRELAIIARPRAAE